MRDEGLACGYVDFSGFVMDSQGAAQDQRVLVKLRSLARFLPAFRTVHVSHADFGGRGMDSADVFFNDLRLVAGGFDARGMGNQGWHVAVW